MILVHFISWQRLKNEELKCPVYERQLVLHFCDADNLNTELKANLPFDPSYSMTFRKEGNKHSDAEKIIHTSVYTWNVCSRQYISDLHLVTTDI
jgi:hypothetical protein